MSQKNWRRQPDSNRRDDGFANRPVSGQKSVRTSSYNNSKNVLADCLICLSKRIPDLGIVVKSWDKLPKAIKAGILALVRATVDQRDP